MYHLCVFGTVLLAAANPAAPEPRAGEGAGRGDDSRISVQRPVVTRFKDNPIIRPEMLSGPIGANICDPSLIRVPDWLEKPLGKYYLYFADHKGSYIRLAYADRLEGPWKVHEPGTLRLGQVVAKVKAGGGDDVKGGHISSPDVLVDDEKKEIRMYFHAGIAPNGAWGHTSGVALSKDGIHFQSVGSKPIGEPYLRVFRRDGFYYAVTRSASLIRSRDGLADFEVGNTAFAEAVGSKAGGPKVLGSKDKDEEGAAGSIRHTALKVDGDVLSVFFSRSGDLPETIMLAQARLTGDWKTWRLSPPVPVLEPERDYEGAKMPPKKPSNQDMRKLPRPLYREVRDPCIYREGGKTYLLYSVAGERGIAIAELEE